MKTKKLNPEVYRAAAKLLYRRRVAYSCYAIRQSVRAILKEKATESDLDQYTESYTEMFGPKVYAIHHRRKIAPDRIVMSIEKEDFKEHPYWNQGDGNGKKGCRAARITALLLMAEIVESGDTF